MGRLNFFCGTCCDLYQGSATAYLLTLAYGLMFHNDMGPKPPLGLQNPQHLTWSTLH